MSLSAFVSVLQEHGENIAQAAGPISPRASIAFCLSLDEEFFFTPAIHARSVFPL